MNIEVKLTELPSGDEVSVRFHGYRAEIGISEVSLIAQYARRPVGPKRLAEELERLQWPADQALEFARIVSRVCELAWTRVRAPRR